MLLLPRAAASVGGCCSCRQLLRLLTAAAPVWLAAPVAKVAAAPPTIAGPSPSFLPTPPSSPCPFPPPLISCASLFFEASVAVLHVAAIDVAVPPIILCI
jgi:hypothetical protein